MDSEFRHTSVLLDECVEFLRPRPGMVLLDATLGGGGHSFALGRKMQPGGVLIGLDRDPAALEAARLKLAPLQELADIILLHSDFGKLDTDLEAVLARVDHPLDGALFDLGVSSHQLDGPRGFSFRRDEPLEMRMDPTQGQTAAELLSQVSEKDLVRILHDFGDERWAARIASFLVAQRAREPIRTTAQLAAGVEQAVPRGAWPRDIHVATRTFQALRIAVNDELGQLEAGLSTVVKRLAPGGRIAVISFHSLEDRIVKHRFAEWSGRVPSAPGSSPAVFMSARPEPILSLLTRKPVIPSEEEIARNPRARSARMRVAERL